MKRFFNIERTNYRQKNMFYGTINSALLKFAIFASLLLYVNASKLNGQFYKLEKPWEYKDILFQVRCDDSKTDIKVDVAYTDGSTFDELMGRPSRSTKTFSLHGPENGHTRGKELDLLLEFKVGRTYYITPKTIEACKECLESYRETFRREFQYKRPDEYEIDFALGDNRGLLINNREQILKASRYGYRIGVETNKTIAIKCVDTSELFLVHNTGNDIPSLPFMRQIADAAYTAVKGDRFRGVLHTGIFPDGPIEYEAVSKTLYQRNADYMTGGRFSAFEFEVIELIEGSNTHAELNPKHKVLGEIPSGFRAIILKSDLRVNGTDYNWGDFYLIAYAGTTNRVDWINNIAQGIPIYNFPRRWLDPYRWLEDQVAKGDGDLFDLRVAPQYTFGRKVCEYVNSHYNRDKYLHVPYHMINGRRANLYVCGHSLGGGIAAYVSGMLGVRGFGFNPAALASGMQAIKNEGVTSPELYFTNVCASEDIVSLLTPLFPKGELLGDIFVVRTKPGSLIEQHSISNLDAEYILDYFPAKKSDSRNGDEK